MNNRGCGGGVCFGGTDGGGVGWLVGCGTIVVPLW